MSKIDRPDFQAPRKLKQAIWSDRGLRLPLGERFEHARWPWLLVVLAPVIGVAVAYIWNAV